jgi:hypothetical protein
MHEVELSDIINRGAERTGATFEQPIVRKIVGLADGFPHFVHLIALYASVSAGDGLRSDPNARPVIDERAYGAGLASAIAKAEHSLQEAYETAVVTTRRKSDIYELTLRALALSDERDVQVREIAEHASFLTREELRPEKFSNALGQLIKPERAQVLTKVRDGYYKFTNPLMRAYVRFLIEFMNITEYDGQLVFPFMR